jgi:type IV pilus assembly protein PilF
MLQSMLQESMRKKRIRYIYYFQISLSLFGLSGCSLQSPLISSQVIQNPIYQAADYNVQLGLAYLQAGDRLQAKEKLFAAERQRPNAASIKSAIAYYLEQIGEWEKAEAYHLQALQLDKHGGAVHNNYGRFLCQCARYHEAEVHFLEAIQDMHYVNTASAYENLGLCAMRIPDAVKAIHYLKVALKHNPQLAKSLLALAQLHSQQPKLAYGYFLRYEKMTIQHTPIALALGVQLALTLQDEAASHRYASLLKAQYPKSPEYQKLLSTYPELIKVE